MLSMSMMKNIWETFNNLYLIGKILFFPIFLAIAISYLCLGILEFITIDIFLIILEASSKKGNVRELISSMIKPY